MFGIRSAGRQFATAARALIVATVVLGIAYPLLVTGVSQVALPAAADGSLVSVDGKDVGSALVGQAFTDADGNALPQYFQSRPSAVGYDASSSGGSNLGPENPDLVSSIADRISVTAALDNVTTDQVTADAVTASASGLDPHISVDNALNQVARVAAERGLDEAAVRELVEDNTEGRMLGFLGEPAVNVLKLNIALDKMDG